MVVELLAKLGLIYALIGDIFLNSIKNLFFDLRIPKLKPILIGVFYRPPNENTFLETFVDDLKLISWRF